MSASQILDRYGKRGVRDISYGPRKWVMRTQRNNIFLMRDPRDVVVSYYHYRLEEDMHSFVRDEVNGIPKIVAFMNVWSKILRKNKNYLIITYEDMIKNTEAALCQILEHMEAKVDREAVSSAVEDCSLELMREWDAKDCPHQKVRRVRKGIVGGYKEELDQKTIDYIDGYIYDNLNNLYKRYKR
jgi:hypothetical protein